jgi:hypothetical protein
MADPNSYLPAVDIVGAVASVIGLVWTIIIFFIAKSAKRLAKEARDAALSTTRKRSLIEDLEDVRRMIQQNGNLIEQAEWTALRMQTDEIVGMCKSAMARWGDGLPIKVKNGVLTAGTLLESIVERSFGCRDRALTPTERVGLNSIHARASGLVRTALGEARRREERDGTKNGN